MKPIKPTYVTQPLMPPLSEFMPFLERIWESKWLTNGGPFHQELEIELATHLGVEHLSLFANGTLALVTALQALRIAGEVITTPYSFVATAHALRWNGIQPVFVDVSKDSFNIDPELIEAAITPQTTAIMPVHVYGYPCDVDRIQKIADTYGLKVIYDAAHAFGVNYRGESLLRHGDLAILSFHATKVFNTFEGGAIICPDAKTKHRIDDLKNFGYAGEVNVVATGINAKMNELQAAFGLLQLRYIDEAIDRRRQLDALYRSQLADIPGLSLPPLPQNSTHNYSYFPILIDQPYPLERDAVVELLRRDGVFARRYFFPLISQFPMYRGLPSAAPARLPQAMTLANQVICLPIYPALEPSTVERITSTLRNPVA